MTECIGGTQKFFVNFVKILEVSMAASSTPKTLVVLPYSRSRTVAFISA